MTTDKPAFVLVHGAWYNNEAWVELVPELADRGFGSVTLDLPGAGRNAVKPASFYLRPLDYQTFSTEPSPNSGVTHEQRVEAVADAVRDASRKGNGKVVLVGHGLAGLTISGVAEAAPESIASMVFLAGFMLGAGSTAFGVINSEVNAGASLAGLYLSDPSVSGALRIDVNSDDPDYLDRLRGTLCGDLDDDQWKKAIDSLTHCDEPAALWAQPGEVTEEKFGSVDRYYIYCSSDSVLTMDAQRQMVETMDADYASETSTVTLDASHSPFLSNAAALADALATIAGG